MIWARCMTKLNGLQLSAMLNFFVCSVTAYLVWNQWNSIVFEGTMILYQVGHGFSVATTAGTCSSTARYYNPAYVTDVSRASNYVFLLSILGYRCVCCVKSSVGFLIFLMKFYYFYPKKWKIIKKATFIYYNPQFYWGGGFKRITDFTGGFRRAATEGVASLSLSISSELSFDC